MKKKKDYRKPNPNYKILRCTARDFETQKRCVNFTEEGGHVSYMYGLARVIECGNRIGIKCCKVNKPMEGKDKNETHTRT